MIDNDSQPRVISPPTLVDAMAEGMIDRFADRAVDVARRQLAAAQDQASIASWSSVIAQLERRRR